MEPEIITKRMVGECSSSVTDSRRTDSVSVDIRAILTYDQVIVRIAKKSH